ncbi:flagellar protein MotY [Denitrificimonas caeni]|uniref:flagellar protein MotY n=1 Tax=Denitrificimonas caeni TaxID=521720 RepID=UPI0003B3DE9A|nr:OmpA family protein [Denitrificimonas caeni]
MRLLVFSILAAISVAPALALTFQTPLEHVEWKVAGDRFECRLMQPVKGFGQGEFVRRAGESPVFKLQAQEQWLSRGSALLVAAAAPWRVGQGDISLGTVVISDSANGLQTSQLQAGRLLTGLLEGRGPLIRHRTQQGDALEVRIMPAHFSDAYQRYLDCTADLFPYNFEQIKQTRIAFPDENLSLSSSAQGRLQLIVDYIKEDPTVNHIELDGHSDSFGNRLSNREISRRRALTVKQYFIDQGIPEEQIVVRFHGERYPLKPNNSPANRALNRRVNVVLSRVPETTYSALDGAVGE